MRASFFTTAILTLLLLASPGCGDDKSAGPDSNGDAALVALCDAQCDQQATASDCPSSVATDYPPMCKQICPAVVASLSADCKTTAEAFYSCGSSAQWQCLPGGNLPQLADASECMAEAGAYADCLQAR